MGTTDAERSRRYRAHKRGDHSMCDPGRCSGGAVTPRTAVTVTRDAPEAPDDGTPRPPGRLRARGRRLWRQLVDEASPGPAEVVLIEELCRLADRCDRLDAILNSRDRAWLTLELPEDGGTELTVVVDKALSEARQQQIALKQIVGELRQMQSRDVGADQPTGGSIRDQLAARRAARLADATGR